MAGLLDGLEKIGLGNLEGMDLYTDKEKAEAEKKKTPAPEIKETDFILIRPMNALCAMKRSRQKP